MEVIREMRPGEEKAVCQLVRQVFDKFVAPQYSIQGRREFLRYAQPQRMAERTRSGHQVLVAEVGGDLVGMIETRDSNHISLLFVAGDCQHRGIARKLFIAALRAAQRVEPDLSGVTVKSSPNAVKAYEALGFQAEGPEREEHGIRYIPMRRTVRADHIGK